MKSLRKEQYKETNEKQIRSNTTTTGPNNETMERVLFRDIKCHTVTKKVNVRWKMISGSTEIQENRK